MSVDKYTNETFELDFQPETETESPEVKMNIEEDPQKYPPKDGPKDKTEEEVKEKDVKGDPENENNKKSNESKGNILQVTEYDKENNFEHISKPKSPKPSKNLNIHGFHKVNRKLGQSPLRARHGVLPEQNGLCRWVLANFKCKKCVIFVPQENGNDNVCFCGKRQADHMLIFRTSNEKWSSLYNTRSFVTNAFGVVTFVKGDSAHHQDVNKAQYIRLIQDTPTNRIDNLIHNVWGMKDPLLLVSIIGGHSQVTKNIQDILEKCISRVLGCADTWFLTSGTNSGYSRIVGDVFQNEVRKDRLHRNACIGIVPWGFVKERNSLKNCGGTVSVNTGLSSEERSLDCNHTHFLLPDNGCIDDHEFQHNFRMNLQRHFMTRTGRSLPSVTIFIDGGISSVIALRHAFTMDPPIPLLVVRESGRVADVIADSLNYYTDAMAAGIAPGKGLFKLIITKLADALGVAEKEDRTIEAATLIKDCIEDYHSKIIVYDQKKERIGIHQALLQTCQAGNVAKSKEKSFSDLQLAMLWDDADIADQDIHHGVANTYLNDVLMKSFISNKVDFVKVILCGGKVDLDLFLTKEMLGKLYYKKLKKGHSRIGTMLTRKEGNNLRSNNTFSLATVDRLLRKLLNGDYTSCYSLRNERKKLITPAQELTIWCILNNMRDMALMLLSLDNNNLLANCLVAYRICDALAYRISEEAVKQSILEDGKFFRDMTSHLLSSYYRYDSHFAAMVVQEPAPLWGYNSILTLSANMSFMTFVAHPVCQKILDREWYWKVNDKQNVWQHSTVHLDEHYQEKLSGVISCRDCKDNKKYNADFGKQKSSRLRLAANMLLALFLVPRLKMYIHVAHYAAFLVLYTYHVLSINTTHKNITQWLVLVMVISLAFDELRQVAEVKTRSGGIRIREWISGVWNPLEAAPIVLGITGFIVSRQNKENGKVINSTALVIFYLKLLQFYRTNKYLGPYIVMISRMLKHMVGFIFVLIVAIVAFGIFMTALLFPNEAPGWKLPFRVLLRPLLLIFGEIGMEPEVKSKVTVFGTGKQNISTEIAVIVATFLYLLFANVLLLNILIAVFNNIYEQVKTHSEEIWKFETYGVIKEFQSKPLLPFPFSIFENILRLGKALLCNSFEREKIAKLNKRRKTEDNYELLDYERRCIRKYWNDLKATNLASTQEVFRSLNTKLEGNSTAIQDLQSKVESRLENIESLLRKLTSSIEIKENQKE